MRAFDMPHHEICFFVTFSEQALSTYMAFSGCGRLLTSALEGRITLMANHGI